MRPRLVATDLDGTLLHSDGTVTARTRAVLEELDARGVPVVFTTGRPIRWMESLWDDVGGHGLAICSNGGIVYDVAARRVRDFRAVPREVGISIAEQVRAAVPGTHFAIEHTAGWASEVDFPSHPDDRAERFRGDYADLFRDDVVKILAVHRELDPEDVLEAGRGRGRRARSSPPGPRPFALVEISAAGVTKATTLAALAAEMGVGAERRAWPSATCPTTSRCWSGRARRTRWPTRTPSVLDLADHLAPGNDEDGVAAVLADLFGLSR